MTRQLLSTATIVSVRNDRSAALVSSRQMDDVMCMGWQRLVRRNSAGSMEPGYAKGLYVATCIHPGVLQGTNCKFWGLLQAYVVMFYTTDRWWEIYLLKWKIPSAVEMAHTMRRKIATRIMIITDQSVTWTSCNARVQNTEIWMK